MKPTRKKERKVKAKEYKVSAWVVDGSWGVTAAFTSKERAIEEMLRIEKVGYTSHVIACTIIYKLPARTRTQ